MEDNHHELGEFAWGDIELEQIVQELHDGPVQLMVGAKMLCESRLATTDADSAAGRDLRRICDLLSRAIQETRGLMHRYGPPDLEESGWHVALRRWASLALGGVEPTIEFELSPETAQLVRPLQRHAYRIVQEAVNNAVRHARATRITVHADRSGDSLHIEIRDDGVGFLADEVAPDRRGLVGMRRRAQLLGGELRIDSRPRAGTTISADLPLKSQA